MPACFCSSNNCNGKSLSIRTHAKHQREDKARLMDEALARAQKLCTEQDSVIAAYIGSLTLSDDVNVGQSNIAGGRIWSRSESFDNPLTAPSSHAPVDQCLEALCEAEHDLTVLIFNTQPQIARLNKPIARGDPFPLKGALSDARAIQDRLASISSRATSVREVKNQISDRLASFMTELKDYHSKWAEASKGLEAVSKNLPAYNNGEYALGYKDPSHKLARSS
ncbi:hypothetical protein CVT26_005969 [Gymnopilus dilepis]|uniref:Uncharacterized protein n=1 Tax=Gymnopilus dilepis TaxID=231916 RepID=A0A409Y1R6_9AGAR|nr:hypothetical protein CVT26_005969 [Gymnopilus dilepis]